MTKQLDFSVQKVDESLGIVFGFAIICKRDGEEYVDVQGDYIPESAMLEATAEYMAGDRVAKDMHLGDSIGQLVYGFPLTDDIAKALEITTRQTGFVVGMKPNDEIMEKFRSGEYTGFSIGGRRIQETVLEE